MSDDWLDSPLGRAVEYGRHTFGVFPTIEGQKVTGILHHDGEYFESYVDSGCWKRYPNWIREYKETPLKDALEAFVNDDEMWTTECSIGANYYPRRELVSAGLSGWRYEYHRKRNFREAILRGNVDLQVTAVINRFGDIYTIEEAGEKVREKYWEFVDENYQHRHDHQAATSSQ